MSTEKNEQRPIPPERDRATGEEGDLGVWDTDDSRAPLEVWDGKKAILAYFSQADLGEHFEDGEEFAVVFTDRALMVEVQEIVTADDSSEKEEKDA